MTPAEAALWNILKGSKLQGRKFRRQHSFAGYIFDFYCPFEKLAIELDGVVHFNEKAAEYDRQRRLFVRYFGITILRIENKWVFEETAAVVDKVQSCFGSGRGIPKEAWIAD